jgi:hypothetical protein
VGEITIRQAQDAAGAKLDDSKLKKAVASWHNSFVLA